MKATIIIRKKPQGENSIEELACRLAKDLDVSIVPVPYHSTTVINLFKNIHFVRKLRSPVFHVISPSEAYLLPFLRGKRIITYHDLGTVFSARNRLYRFMRFLLHIFPSKYFADQITFVSEQTKREYLAATKYKRLERLHVIYNSYDERLIPVENKTQNEKFTVLQIGTAKRKNLMSTIHACVGLPIRLNIIGKLTDEYLGALSRYNIDYKNSFDISYEKIVECYNQCDIVCFPSFYEGFGIPLIEANVMQKPIIAGDIPVLHEIGDDAALFVNPKSVEEIRDAIISLMTDSALREKYIQAGITNAKKYGHRYIANEYYQIYSKSLNTSL